jgi:hypothetical protein
LAEVTFTPNLQPAPACYPSDVNGLLTMMTTGGGISGTVPDNAGGGVFVGSTPPSSSLTNKVWYKTDAAGRPLGVFMFYNGNWRKVYTGVGVGEIRMYIGTNAVFDGNGLGLIGGDFDGWQLCNGNSGTPNLEGYFMVGGVWGTQVGQGAGWFTDADGVAWRSSGGRKGPALIQPSNLPPLQIIAAAFGAVGASPGYNLAAGGESGPGGSATWPIRDANGLTLPPQTAMPTPILYFALAYMMFIGYA